MLCTSNKTLTSVCPFSLSSGMFLKLFSWSNKKWGCFKNNNVHPFLFVYFCSVILLSIFINSKRERYLKIQSKFKYSQKISVSLELYMCLLCFAKVRHQWTRRKSYKCKYICCTFNCCTSGIKADCIVYEIADCLRVCNEHTPNKTKLIRW